MLPTSGEPQASQPGFGRPLKLYKDRGRSYTQDMSQPAPLPEYSARDERTVGDILGTLVACLLTVGLLIAASLGFVRPDAVESNSAASEADVSEVPLASQVAIHHQDRPIPPPTKGTAIESEVNDEDGQSPVALVPALLSRTSAWIVEAEDLRHDAALWGLARSRPQLGYPRGPPSTC